MMFDGSTKKRREVSLRGKSRQEGRKEAVEKARLARENRAREKRELDAAKNIQRVTRSYVIRRREKESFRSELVLGLTSGGNSTRLISLFTLGFESRIAACRPFLETTSALCAHVNRDISGGGSLLRDPLFRPAVFTRLLLRTLVESNRASDEAMSDNKEDNFLHASTENICKCINLISDLSRWPPGIFGSSISPAEIGRAERRISLGLVENESWQSIRGRSAGPATDALGVLVRRYVPGASPSAETVATVRVLTKAFSLRAQNAVASDSAWMTGFLETLLSQPFSQLQKTRVDQLIMRTFSVESWSFALSGLAGGKLASPEALSNTIRISFDFRGQHGQSKGGSSSATNFTCRLFDAVGDMLARAPKENLLHKVAEMAHFCDPVFIQTELRSALGVVDTETRARAVISLIRVLETIRQRYNRVSVEALAASEGPFDTTSVRRNALSALSPASIVVSAVAFSSRSNPSLVALIWRQVLLSQELFDRASGKVHGDKLFALGFSPGSPGSQYASGALHSTRVSQLISFACSATSTLLAALDDEEIFLKGEPLGQSDLRDIALFTKEIVYFGLWVQAEESGQGLKRSSAKMWAAPPTGSSKEVSRRSAVDLPTSLISKAVELFNQLFERHGRHKIMDDSLWLFPEIGSRELGIDERRRVKMYERLGIVRQSQHGGRHDDAMDDSDDEDGNDDGASSSPNSLTPAFASARAKRVLSELPQVVKFEERVLLLDHYLTQDRLDNSDFRGLRGIGLPVRRGYEYSDAFKVLVLDAQTSGHAPPLKGRVQVEFTNSQGLAEAGIDGGGLFKDFLMEFFKQAFDPDRGLWKMTANNELFPNPGSGRVTSMHLLHFEFQGRMLGKAMYEGILVELELAGFFLNLMLGYRNHMHDLQSLDPELYKNVLQLKSMPDPGVLDLTFSATSVFNVSRSEGTKVVGSKEVDLIPGGAAIAVTKDNYIHYIRRLCSFRLNEEFHEQSQAFLRGFSDMVPKKWIRMFKPHELRLVIGGAEGGFDVEDMRTACMYTGGYHPSQPYIQDFWDVVRSFTDHERALLLRFITSCSKPPLQGFRSLNPRLCVSQVRDATRLATASTCVNLLKLPMYASKELLREKLLYSISSSSGFELS